MAYLAIFLKDIGGRIYENAYFGVEVEGPQ